MIEQYLMAFKCFVFNCWGTHKMSNIVCSKNVNFLPYSSNFDPLFLCFSCLFAPKFCSCSPPSIFQFFAPCLDDDWSWNLGVSMCQAITWHKRPAAPTEADADDQTTARPQECGDWGPPPRQRQPSERYNYITQFVLIICWCVFCCV